MFGFLRGMVVSWLLFTTEGKNILNSTANALYKSIKKNMSNTSEKKETVVVKDTFVKNNEDINESNKHINFNNRPKN